MLTQLDAYAAITLRPEDPLTHIIPILDVIKVMMLKAQRNAANEQRNDCASRSMAVGDLAKSADEYFAHFGDDDH